MLPEAARAVNRDASSGAAYVACGHHAALAFLEKRPHDVSRVVLSQGGDVDVAMRVRASGLRPEPAEPALLGRLSQGLPHQGIVAMGTPPSALPLAGLDPARHRLILALDGVTDPRNVGAMVRTAEAAGVAAVLVTKDRAPGWSPALVRAAAGAVEWLPFVRVTNLARSLGALGDAGYWVLGLDGAAEVDIYSAGAVPGLPCVLVVGSEGEGIRPLVARSCHRLVSIPMTGRTASLNVSVAAAVAMFEIFRLARAGGGA